MTTPTVIGLLLRLYPPAWRAEYGAELREMLEDGPLTPSAVLDVAKTGVGLRLARHDVAWRLIFAAVTSTVIEFFAVSRQLTDNVLWLPDTPARAATLTVLGLGWAPFTVTATKRVHHRLSRHHHSPGSVRETWD